LYPDASETALVYRFFRDNVISGFLLAGALWFIDAAIFWKQCLLGPRRSW
jgi:hypothetical protein